MNAYPNRRTVVRVVVGATATLLTAGRVYGQEASPEAHDHAAQPSRPMPETTVTFTDTALTFPAELPAGINKVIFENKASMDAHVLTFRLPDDVDMESFMAVLMDPEAPMPDYLRDQYFPGIPDLAQPGETLTGYIRYEAGEYIAVNLEGPQAPAFFSVVGDSWGVVPPHTDHEIGMVEMTFLGLDEPVAAGEQILSVVNYGATWHEVMLIRMPEMMTPDELLEAFMSTSEGADLTEMGYSLIGGSAIMSPGTQMGLEVTLEAGPHAALCFAPDDFAGPPHALAGMISTFMVE